MKIKVCGNRDAENIHELPKLPIDWLGYDFRVNSPKFVRQVSSQAGIMPDYGSKEAAMGKEMQKPMKQKFSFGIFADDMPQSIVTRIVNFNLDIVQLDGEESAVMIDNLRCTVIPDIRKEIQIIKTIPITSEEDFKKCEAYEGHSDYILFKIENQNIEFIEQYKGNIPFFVSINDEQIDKVKLLNHALFVGIDLEECNNVEKIVKNLKP